MTLPLSFKKTAPQLNHEHHRNPAAISLRRRADALSNLVCQNPDGYETASKKVGSQRVQAGWLSSALITCTPRN